MKASGWMLPARGSSHPPAKASPPRLYAINREDIYLGDMNVAAAVIGAQGVPMGAVHVPAPTSRWSMADAELRLVPAALECARNQ